MQTDNKLSIELLSSNRLLAKRVKVLAHRIARELDNINQGVLHLGVYRVSPRIKPHYDELFKIYEKIFLKDSGKGIIRKVSRLSLLLPLQGPHSAETIICDLIILDVSLVRLGIDFYSEHDDTLELPVNFKTDRYGLTEMSEEFILERQGIIYGDNLVYYHPFMRRFFTARFVDTPSILSAIRDQGRASVKVALDPVRHTEATNLDHTVEFDHWWGANFDVDKLDDRNYVGTTVHGRKPNSELLDMTFPLIKTVFYVSDYKGSEKEFQIEEIIPTDSEVSSGIKYTLHRYAHFIWNSEGQNFRHFDCSVRIYSKEEHHKRLGYDWKQIDNDYAQTFKRKKLFRIDGEISVEQVKDLLFAFFRYNELVMEYFGASPDGLDA